MNLQGKVVIITGASRGLGRELALAFSKELAHVVASARSSKELKVLEGETKGISIQADVIKDSDMLQLAKKTVSKFGRIDIWVNNAGIWIPHGPVEELNFSRVRDVIEVNLFGTMHGSKAALLQMKKQGNGMIINILSTSALDARAGSSAYGASKYGIIGFAKALRKEAEPSDIRVVNIYPGGMRTHLFDEKIPDNYSSYMNPKEVAQKIVENLKKENPEEELILKRPKP
ncbi:MAG: SDR family oxidoreductase [Candidatus Diapherotrites archaeon]|nr:SDR family oxidoreductase [Candidatus Diapherotrites archaeon]